MSAVTRALLAVLLAGCLASCTTRDVRPAPGPTKVTLFFTAELKGYIAPCGCSENMRGGIARTAHVIASARSATDALFYFDSGDGFFGAAAIPGEAVAQQERKAKALADAFKAIGLTARAPGPLDDARGAKFRSSLGAPELAAEAVTMLDAKGHRLAVISAADLARAIPLAKKARADGASFVVALVPQPFEVLLRGVLDAGDVDLVLASKAKDELSADENKLVGGVTRVAQVQSKGRSLLRVDLVLRDGNRVEWLKGSAEKERELGALDQRIELLRTQVNEPMLGEQLKALRRAKLDELTQRRAALADEPLPVPGDRNAASFRLVPIESSLPREPAVAAIETSYDEAVGALNLAWAKEHGEDCEPSTPLNPGYVGSAVCLGCHKDAAAVWRKTKHPLAFEALTAQHKQYHLDCIACHVTGWKQPGGVCRVDRTESREEVGCEACHGPGYRHVILPTKETTARRRDKDVCLRCHDHENSPHFDFDQYVERILGPGHGKPKE